MGDSRHTQNIQNNKVIGDNEKCLSFNGKTHTHILANPIYRGLAEVMPV